MDRADLVVVSNRGPLAFSFDDSHRLVIGRAAGGLISTLAPAIAGSGATWFATAISDADRAAADQGLIESEGFRLRSLVIEPEAYRMFYDVVANETLWFLHHGLYDLARRPRLDRTWRGAWDAYVEVNRTIASAVADEAPENACVIVHDYHLALAGRVLGSQRPDLRTTHFSHTPFAEPLAARVLPDDVARQLLRGMAAFGSRGFHSRRWATCFEASCQAVLGSAPSTFVAPAAVDAADAGKVAASEECGRELAALEERLGDRRAIVRVDRLELSKNLLRGFYAFDELLREHPSWRGAVVFAALVYPSREELSEYVGYRQEVEALAAQLNERWGTAEWTPIILDISDYFPGAVAALRRYDVLLVNPIRDGLNVVAKEGPLVNDRDGVLVLSREAGVADELEGHLTINPFDVAETAAVLEQALRMDAGERAARALALRESASRRTPADWVDDLTRAAVRPGEGVRPAAGA